MNVGSVRCRTGLPPLRKRLVISLAFWISGFAVFAISHVLKSVPNISTPVCFPWFVAWDACFDWNTVFLSTAIAPEASAGSALRQLSSSSILGDSGSSILHGFDG